jgi:hypothetical protein
MPKMVYIVRGAAGEYSDRHSWTVAAFDDQDQANWWKDQCQAQSDKTVEQGDWYDQYRSRVTDLTDKYVGEQLPVEKQEDYAKVYTRAHQRALEEAGSEYNVYDPDMADQSEPGSPARYWVEPCIMNPEVKV